MASIVASIKDVFASIFELIWSFFTTAGHLIEKTFAFIVRSFEELINLFLNFFKGLVHLTGDLGSFVAGNIVILVLLGLAVFGFLSYQRNQGNQVKVGNKKLN